MKKLTEIFVVLVLASSLSSCQKKEVSITDIEKLCSYKGKSIDVSSVQCQSSEFIVQLTNALGSMLQTEELGIVE